MDSDHALTLFLALVLVGAAVALAYSSPLVFGGEEDGVTDATLASFETTDPYCGDPDTISESSRAHDRAQGEALVINQTVPIPTNDTTVNATLDEFGPQRFILEVERDTDENQTATETPTPTGDAATEATTPADGDTESANSNASGDDNGECHPEIQYNATININQPGEYTVLVTYDDELVTVHWRDGDDSGSYSSLPDTPEVVDSDNSTETDGQTSVPSDL